MRWENEGWREEARTARGIGYFLCHPIKRAAQVPSTSPVVSPAALLVLNTVVQLIFTLIWSFYY